MKWNKEIFGLLLLSLSVLACNSTSQNAEEERQIFFFDLQTYFDEEIERLSELQPKVEKILSIDQEEEILSVDTLNYANELEVFRQSDINKVSWQDKYQAYTTRNVDGEAQRIVYTALDEKLGTRSIDISFKEGKPQQISIQKAVQSPVLQSSQDLIYQPKIGFSIAQKQKVKLMAEKELKVKVRY